MFGGLGNNFPGAQPGNNLFQGSPFGNFFNPFGNNNNNVPAQQQQQPGVSQQPNQYQQQGAPVNSAPNQQTGQYPGNNYSWNPWNAFFNPYGNQQQQPQNPQAPYNNAPPNYQPNTGTGNPPSTYPNANNNYPQQQLPPQTPQTQYNTPPTSNYQQQQPGQSSSPGFQSPQGSAQQQPYVPPQQAPNQQLPPQNVPERPVQQPAQPESPATPAKTNNQEFDNQGPQGDNEGEQKYQPVNLDVRNNGYKTKPDKGSGDNDRLIFQ